MKFIKRAFRAFAWTLANFKEAILGIENTMYAKKGYRYADQCEFEKSKEQKASSKQVSNPLRKYFDENKTGNGIWKFLHYFDIYQRHFEKFVGKEVHIVEVGVYSGGSLKMWKSYFGDKCKIYGVDIQVECKQYEDDQVKIFIGDQEDREFWKDFKKKVPRVDILVDDGGHLAAQQIVTLEEILQHISPGGVYLCEDVVGSRHKFTSYVNGLQHKLNTRINIPDEMIRSKNTAFQQHVFSIHQYPYVFVIEKPEEWVDELVAPKHGTVWGPFVEMIDR